MVEGLGCKFVRVHKQEEIKPAIQQANASGGTSTINLPAGVYPLNASNTGEFNGSHSLQIGVGNGSFWRKSLRSPGDGDNLFLTLQFGPD